MRKKLVRPCDARRHLTIKEHQRSHAFSDPRPTRSATIATERTWANETAGSHEPTAPDEKTSPHQLATARPSPTSYR